MLAVLSLSVFACNQPGITETKINIQKSQGEQPQNNCKLFLEKFLTDSTVQKSSITFPLKSVIQSEDGDTIKFIKQEQWKYVNFSREKDFIIYSELIDKNKFRFVVQIEDTGVYVLYHFEYKNAKWWLTLIEDAST